MAASSSDASVQQARLNSSKYCKKKIPILSKHYKSLVSQVKSKKLQVEEKKADFQNLGINKKDELPSLVLGTASSASVHTNTQRSLFRMHKDSHSNARGIQAKRY